MHIKSIQRNVFIRILLPLMVAGIPFSCKDKTEISENNVERAAEQNTVALSKEQKNLSDIQTGKLVKMNISPETECNGKVILLPNNRASVAVPMKGFVKSIQVVPGEYVPKNTLLAELTHPEYIQLQEEYLSIKSELEYLREEYKRQGELTVEQAASIKSMQKAQADFLSREARFFSLRLQLEMLGINPDSVTQNRITQTIQLKAPISGNIAIINANLGKLVSPEEQIFEIINPSGIMIELSVYEKDVPFLEKGQAVSFSPAGNPTKKYRAVIASVGQQVDENTRTLPAYLKIENNKGKLKPGMFVQANIIQQTNLSWVIPETGLIREDQQAFLFNINNQGRYKRVQVKTGISNGRYTEVIQPDSFLLKSTIVIQGAYYLNAEMSEE